MKPSTREKLRKLQQRGGRRLPPLLLQPMESRRYIIARDWETPHGWVVPMGFQTDGASIPRLFWFLVGSPFTPEVIEGATLHDYLYSTPDADTTRREADDVFHSFMRQRGVGRLRARLMWLAVRLFGWLFYERARKA